VANKSACHRAERDPGRRDWVPGDRWAVAVHCSAPRRNAAAPRRPRTRRACGGP